MLIHFLLVGGWIFWAVLGVIAFLEIMLLANDMETESFPVLVAMAAIAGVALFTDAFSGVRLELIAALAIAYVAAGVLWSIKKWYSLSVEKRDEAKNSYARADKSRPGNETWETYSQDYRPRAADNKQRIITWMTLWPFSFSWWVMTWPRRLFSWLYGRLSTLFDRITSRVFNSP